MQKEKFIKFSNLFLIVEIVMIIIIFFPFNEIIQLITILLSFGIAIVYIIYATVYFLKRRSERNHGS